MSSIVIKGNTSGQIELAAPDVAGSTTLTLPTGSGNVITDDGSGNVTLSGNITPSGIYLGGTASANLLDDYEEGTWTITTNSDATGVIGSQAGYYTKIGNVVHCWGQFSVATNFTDSAIGGLPFVNRNIFTLSNVSGQGVVIGTGLANTIILHGTEAASTIIFTNSGSVGSAEQPNTADDVYRFYFTYMTDS